MTDSVKQKHEKPNIEGDRINVFLLVLMYSFQGVVHGFTISFPIIFQNRRVSYADQAQFSFVSYPFCFKLVWAPIVDCVFSKRFGRRKTWIIPTQYFMGALLLFVSMHLDDLLGSEDGTQKPKILLLGVIFFTCNLLSAAQDVALDGWSLTMLQRRNVGYAGLTQSIGGVLGQFCAYVLFIIFDSKDFANKFRTIPKDHGLVSFSEYMFFWAMVFIISTTLIFLFKKDNSLEVIDDEDCECRLGLKESYLHLWNIFKLRPILILSLILLTFFMGFGPAMGVAHLKMIDVGIPRDDFVLLTIPALPLQLILTILLRRATSGPKSMYTFIKTYVIFSVFAHLLAISLFFAPYVRDQRNVLPFWYYCVLFFFFNVRNVVQNLMRLSICSFFCRVSDPRYGGIYLTLLNTIMNIGLNWPQTLSLWIVDPLTLKTCEEGAAQVPENCVTKLDGFYIESAIFAAIGAIWYFWGKKESYKLQKLEPSLWIAERSEQEMAEYEKVPTPTHAADDDSDGV